MVYELAFVDSISASPTVRLDLTLSPWAVQSTTRFTPPELRRAAVSTLLTDGERYPAAAYDNRVIMLVAQIQADSDDAAAAALQDLVRELDRPSNVLMWRPETSEPVFFRTFRAGPDNIRWDPVLKEVTAAIPAEPFGYGLKETLSQVTVYNDPAAVSNGAYFDVTTPKGDVETPLFLQLAQGSVTDLRQSVIGVRRRGTPSTMPMLLQAETMTLGTDTTLAVSNDPIMSGSGQNYVRVSFTTAPGLTVRVSNTAWPPTGVDARGTYRVLVRVRQSNPADTMRLRISMGGVNSDVVTLDTGPTGTADYVDMGLMQLPPGGDPVTDGYSGTELSVESTGMSISAARDSGSGTLDIDHVLLVPADDRLCVIDWPPDTTVTSLVLDSARTMVYALGSGGQVRATVQAKIAGLPPMVSPGVTSRVVFVQDTGALQNDTTSRVAQSTVITPYYWPRYLHIPGVGS